MKKPDATTVIPIDGWQNIVWPQPLGNLLYAGRAATQTLKKYTKNGSGMVLKASKENFQEAFVWLSSSMSVVSNSDPAMNKVELEPLPNTITVEL